MSIGRHAGNPGKAGIVSPETMYQTILELGIVPFFENEVPGYSIEEHTPPRFWFDGDGAALGPWDWKIDCVQSGDIAYGKFLLAGKAAFATVEWYRELLNWRRSLPKYQPGADGQRILDYLAQNGSIGIREVRGLLGVKKSAADAAITRLQLQCRVVTGDILRVYRGEDLHYNGWQTSSFCTPEALFDDAPGPFAAQPWGAAAPPAGVPAGVASGLPARGGSGPEGSAEVTARPTSGPAGAGPSGLSPGPAGFPFGATVGLQVDHSPQESLARLTAHIRTLCPGITDRQLQKLLG